MTNEFVLEAITREFPESVISSSEPYGMLTIEVKKEDIKKSFIILKIHHWKSISLPIYAESIILNSGKGNRRCLSLHNMMTNFRLRLKIFMSRENIEVDSFRIYMQELTGWKEKRMISMELNLKDIRI
jgi:NADH-quinone oxidoreductase subunit C